MELWRERSNAIGFFTVKRVVYAFTTVEPTTKLHTQHQHQDSSLFPNIRGLTRLFQKSVAGYCVFCQSCEGQIRKISRTGFSDFRRELDSFPLENLAMNLLLYVVV